MLDFFKNLSGDSGVMLGVIGAIPFTYDENYTTRDIYIYPNYRNYFRQ